MEKIFQYIKISAAAACTLITNQLGGWDTALRVLVIMTILDYITGVLVALSEKKVSSNISYKGIIKKVGIYVIVAVGCLIDQAASTGQVLRTMVIGFYIATEGISLVENWGKLGLPLPEILKQALQQLKQKSDTGVEE